MNTLQTVDLNFFETAPVRSVLSIETQASPEQIFATLRGDTIWTEWAAGLNQVTWTTPTPHGKDSQRTVELMAGMVVKETFFHWQEGERVAFYVTDSNIPGIAKFAEDYRIRVTPQGTTELTWIVAVENTLGFMKLFGPISSWFTRLYLKGWLKNYKRLLDEMALAASS